MSADSLLQQFLAFGIFCFHKYVVDSVDLAAEENVQLLEHVSRLQAIDAQLNALEKDGMLLEDNVMNITIRID